MEAKPNILIRDMELEDLADTFALGEKLFTADKWPNLYRTWDEYELTGFYGADGAINLVAVLDEQIVGFALGHTIEKRRNPWTYGYLVWLGVDPDIGRRGVGSRLIRKLTDRFVAMGARMMMVDTAAENEGAITLFTKHGFGNETAHVYLTKNLTGDPAYKRHRRRTSRDGE